MFQSFVSSGVPRSALPLLAWGSTTAVELERASADRLALDQEENRRAPG